MSEPARRFVIAQSWWIASELVRRSPTLLLLETHPGGGQSDCLGLIRRTTPGAMTLIDLNRAGSIHVHRGPSGHVTLPWEDALTAAGGHDVVRRLERAAGLTPAQKAPATGPRVLTYRVLARILSSLVDDRHVWDARNGQLDSSGMDGADSHRPELERFSSVVESLRDRRPDDLDGRPGYRFWILLRDAEPIAVFDIDGRLHLPDRPPSELLPVYKRSRSLTAVIGAALGHVLP